MLRTGKQYLEALNDGRVSGSATRRSTTSRPIR